MHIISLIFQCKVRDLVYVRMIFHLPKGKNLEERRVLKVVIMWTVQNDLCRPACHLAVISDGNWLSFPCRLVSPLLRNERSIFFISELLIGKTTGNGYLTQYELLSVVDMTECSLTYDFFQLCFWGCCADVVIWYDALRLSLRWFGFSTSSNICLWERQ